MSNASTAIEWTDKTWNPVTGCDKVSPGCTNCYAGELVETRLKHTGLPQYRDGFFGNVQVHPHKLREPLKWRKPCRIFVNSMSDLFHEKVPFEFIAAVFGVMAACPQHTFQVLTKRPERMLEWLRWVESNLPAVLPVKSATLFNCLVATEEIIEELGGVFDAGGVMNSGPHRWPLPNVWLGVSVEDQKRADERIPLLLQCPAAIRFLSCEPLLGPLDLNMITPGNCNCEVCSYSSTRCPASQPYIDWLICGGESGPKARAMDVRWVQSIRDQCIESGVPFFFKQYSGRNPKKFGRLLDGREWNQYPAVENI